MSMKRITQWMVTLVSMLATGCTTTQFKLASVAQAQVGTYYQRGSTEQCGAFVAHCVRQAGGQPPAGYKRARNWQQWGRGTTWQDMRPGDVVVCWRNGKWSGDGHVLLYVGKGMAVHRSRSNLPVRSTPVAPYRARLLAVRRGP
jgi:cell wall-associated NlpC family hydrolase